ncbi:hypothetical protein B0H34DRAFT_694488 [Crassisporium funariophilum]|nr:hypothetical protein B0H34DRAFT_694488 [Crassisporium funariophilum]
MLADDGTIPDIREPPLFMRTRSLSFSCIIFLSFSWTIFLSIVLFLQWDMLDHTQRSSIAIMLCINAITVIMMPILLLQPFRPWLDAARFLLLIILHFGIAGFIVSRDSTSQCSAQPGDQAAVCSLIILFVTIASWLVPVLVIGYLCGLTFLMFRLSKLHPAPEGDIEKQDFASRHTSSTQSQSTIRS